MSQFQAIVELSALDGADGFRLDGAEKGGMSGASVASAGDVNGDGLDDMIIGAYRAGPNGDYSGAAYVVFGKTGSRSSAIQLSSLSAADGFRIDGAAIDDQLGRSVASAGDVDGDGIDDLIVGAGGTDSGGEYSNSGSSYVIFGRKTGFPRIFEVSALNGKNGFRLDGGSSAEERNDEAGRSVAAAGDVNGDGIGDLIVGAYRADPNGEISSGSSYVVFGSDSGFPASIDLATLGASRGFRIDGERNTVPRAEGYASGIAVSSAGDIDGDGNGDLMVGAHRANHGGRSSGSTYVIFGRDTGFGSSLQLAALNGKNGFRLDGAAALDRSGLSIATAGDVNGDGFADMIVGASLASPLGGSGKISGASYVIFGKAGAFAPVIGLESLAGKNGFRIDGARAQERSGISVSSAGDVNGDGFDDVIVGAYYANTGGDNSGASYVVFGKAAGFAASINLSALNGNNGFRIDGVSDYDQSGRAVASAGDINGDGLGDLIVGAPGASPRGANSGSSYVVYGCKPDTAVDRTGTVADQTLAGGEFDDTLSALAGDDRLYAHGGDDTVSGGTGQDWVNGGAGDDRLSGGTGRDTIAAGFGNDTVNGDDGDDSIDGGLGNDLLVAGAGADSMSGGGGSDTFNGGAGKDTMTGGAGPDSFSFAAEGWGGDIIADFDDGADILRFKSTIADDVRDFRITGGGTAAVTIAIGTNTLVLHGDARIFISNADFDFFT